MRKVDCQDSNSGLEVSLTAWTFSRPSETSHKGMGNPEATFYVTGGTLGAGALCYVERRADRDLLEALRIGEFCYVLTSRQMGKSSLMVRTAVKLREAGIHVIALDLTAIGLNLTAEQWYDGLVMRMGRHLRLEDASWNSARVLVRPCPPAPTMAMLTLLLGATNLAPPKT